MEYENKNDRQSEKDRKFFGNEKNDNGIKSGYDNENDWWLFDYSGDFFPFYFLTLIKFAWQGFGVLGFWLWLCLCVAV